MKSAVTPLVLTPFVPFRAPRPNEEHQRVGQRGQLAQGGGEAQVPRGGQRRAIGRPRTSEVHK